MLSESVGLSKPLAAVWVLPAIAGVVLLFATRGQPAPRRKSALRVVRFLVVVYLIGIVLITLWPLHFDPNHHGLEKGNRIPFHGTLGFVTSRSKVQQRIGDLDFLANVLLYIPFGVLLPFAIDRPGAVLVTLALGAALALGLELVQGAYVVQRTFDIDDAISGFAGACIGVAAASITRPIVRSGLVARRRS